MLKEGPAGGSSSQWPGQTSLGGRGVLSMQWSVLYECPRGAAAPKARAHQPRGNGESCPCGGRRSRRGLRGEEAPNARAHQLRGTGIPAQAVVGAQGGPAGGRQLPTPGHTSRGGR